MAKSSQHISKIEVQANELSNAKISNLFQRISERIEQSRNEIVRNANAVLLITNYEIGRYIVEDEQQGESRAEYGKQVLKELSKLLTKQYGRGWSERNLTYYCQFYRVYSNSLNAFSKSDLNIANVFAKFKNTKLSWSHYLILMRIVEVLQDKLNEWVEEIQENTIIEGKLN